MMDIFASIFDSVETMGPTEFLVCVGAALVIGFSISAVYAFRNKHSSGFSLTIGVLPAIVAVVIMVVSGDIGAGIAVAGAFSLVRFRSAPGTAKEIVVIFLSMATGLLIGMGFIAYSAIFAAIICIVLIAFSNIQPKLAVSRSEDKIVKVTVPEDLDYNSEIDTVIEQYTEKMELISVKSANMGSMFRLTYHVTLKDVSKQKELIDQIRIRNGNLEVAICREDTDPMRGL
jgi:uncharacterized membrane protein YhiD involved in acid resistance